MILANDTGAQPLPTHPPVHPPRRPPDQQSIFLAVASYCDPMLGFTLRSAFSQAACPQRVFAGVVEQALPAEQLQLDTPWSAQHLRWARLHALQARGPCWARALGMSLYQGEDWYFQVDSHTWFEPGWDERLLHWAAHCSALNPRHLISCYPNPFHMQQGEPFANVVGPQVLAHAVADGQHLNGPHPVLMFQGVPLASEVPVRGFHIGAGCLWAPGSVVQELPYDPFLFFHGEEQALALRAWTHGWDIFHIPGMPIYHLYHQAGAAPRPLHWSPELDQQRVTTAAHLTEAANQRLAALLWQRAKLGVYGLGAQRSLADFARFSGIDYTARRIEPRAFRGAGQPG